MAQSAEVPHSLVAEQFDPWLDVRTRDYWAGIGPWKEERTK